MDELRAVADLRPQPPGPAPAAVAAARSRLDEAAADAQRADRTRPTSWLRPTRRARPTNSARPTDSAQPTSWGHPTSWAQPAGSMRIPLGWRLAGAGVLSAAIVAGLVAVETLGDPERGGPLTPEPAAAAQLLDRAARAVTAQPYAAPRPDQFGYQDLLIDQTDSDGRFREQARTWTSVGDAGATPKVCSRKVTEPPERFDCAQPPHADTPPGGSGPRVDSYEYLRALPRDPQRLLDELGAKATEPALVPEIIADLAANPLTPPDVRAALFRAVARIPGITTANGVTDAAGRTGAAVSWVADGLRCELIFERDTDRYLGYRMVLVDTGRYKDLAGVPAGTVVHGTALLAGGVVDRAGDLP